MVTSLLVGGMIQAHKAVFLKYLSQLHMTGIEQFVVSSVRRHDSTTGAA